MGRQGGGDMGAPPFPPHPTIFFEASPIKTDAPGVPTPLKNEAPHLKNDPNPIGK